VHVINILDLSDVHLDSAPDRDEWSAFRPTLYPNGKKKHLNYKGTSLSGFQKSFISFGEEGNLLPLLGLDTKILETIG